ncbi:MAG: hypothetical protein ACRD1G_05960 [Acidimicrobiales bacterium]
MLKPSEVAPLVVASFIEALEAAGASAGRGQRRLGTRD